MAPRDALLSLAALAVAACGGQAGQAGPGHADGGTTPAVASCTGSIPANAVMCPGADAGLVRDAPRVVTGTSCDCGGACVPTPCTYVCEAGYTVSDGACVAVPPPPVVVQSFDNGDGTVTLLDDLGRTTWLADGGCSGAMPWDEAQAWVAGLASGACGLADGSAPGDWLLPGPLQLLRLGSVLAAQGPFVHVGAEGYWSSFQPCIGYAGAVNVVEGRYLDVPPTALFQVWPVRR
ncbi:hypothetical protein [Anaeromyxobacter paludicola]|uniref:Lipoprotein n=1 Tax=Anaeromyxobacter paludicola TaxID=2918171 RepID=A0ABM7XE33_9BACT|nr:hypothetical protein [Anaeromyxobacter paludicola]BDG10071.1 hypothetical protein AMPC_31840 [Anaeromyxobacter paludicola]